MRLRAVIYIVASSAIFMTASSVVSVLGQGNA